MVANDKLSGEDLIRKRRAFQRFVLENPNMRIPIQAGDTSGIDAETGWDYSIDDADPYKHIVPDKKEIRRLAIEISEAFERGGQLEVQAVIEGARVREDYKKRREKEYANRGKQQQQPVTEEVPTPTPTKEEFEAEFRAMSTPQPMPESIQMSESYDVLGTISPPQEEDELQEIQVPEDFKGVTFVDNHKGDGDPTISRWKQMQFQCVMRPDLDTTFPDSLEDDILVECKDIAVVLADERFVIAVTGGPPDTPEKLLYTEMLPADKYSIALRGFIEVVKLDEQQQQE